MINILIRTSNRPQLFRRCMVSIHNQIYQDINLIICTDLVKSLDYVKAYANGLSYKVFTTERSGVQYSWNLYCNQLKERVTDGWFFYLDDDDYLIDKFCLAQIAPHLSEDHGTICQFNRGRRAKPRLKVGDVKPEEIIQGRIGGSCIFLHHTHKHLADWDDKKAADFRYIRDVAQKLPLKFIDIVVVQAGNNGLHGKN